MANDLKELTGKRQKHVQSCKENDDNSHQLIAEAYSDPSHFIYEILQNADDAEATNIVFKLSNKCLKITHNGNKKFDFDDVNAITTIGSSTKVNDINKIGKFGAGFKSVFAITETPEIHSGKFHFYIEKYIVPIGCDPINTNNETIFIIPFNNNKISADKAYKIVSKKLETIEPECLLFLKYLRKIQWETKENNGHYLQEISFKYKNKRIKRVKISQLNEKDKYEEYLVIEKKIDKNYILILTITKKEDETASITTLHPKDHADKYEELKKGWKEHYWSKWKKYIKDKEVK